VKGLALFAFGGNLLAIKPHLTVFDCTRAKPTNAAYLSKSKKSTVFSPKKGLASLAAPGFHGVPLGSLGGQESTCVDSQVDVETLQGFLLRCAALAVDGPSPEHSSHAYRKGNQQKAPAKLSEYFPSPKTFRYQIERDSCASVRSGNTVFPAKPPFCESSFSGQRATGRCSNIPLRPGPKLESLYLKTGGYKQRQGPLGSALRFERGTGCVYVLL
jgi:hypothetical protein